MAPRSKIVVPLLGITALMLGFFFLGRLYLDPFPRGVNPYWEYFWLHWTLFLVFGCFGSAYALLRPRPWGWFFIQLMLVLFYFGYWMLKLVLIGPLELGSFFIVHFLLFVLAIGCLQHPEIRERFGIEHTRRPRRILGNVSLLLLGTGMVPLIFSFWLGQHFPPLEKQEWTVKEGAGETFRPDLPVDYQLSFPKGTRVINAYRFWIDSERLKESRTSTLKESFVSYSFAPSILLLETPKGTRIVLEERSYVQNLLSSISARSHFHFMNFNPSPYLHARKWFGERTGLFFVIERLMEMDFKWGMRSVHSAMETEIHGIPAFVEAYRAGKENPKRVLHYHLYREGHPLGAGYFFARNGEDFTQLLASLKPRTTGIPTAEKFFQQGNVLNAEGKFGEATFALASALFLDDEHAEYHYQFARALLKSRNPVDTLTFHTASTHLQSALELQPDYPEVLMLAREYNLIE